VAIKDDVQKMFSARLPLHTKVASYALQVVFQKLQYMEMHNSHTHTHTHRARNYFLKKTMNLASLHSKVEQFGMYFHFRAIGQLRKHDPQCGVTYQKNAKTIYTSEAAKVCF